MKNLVKIYNEQTDLSEGLNWYRTAHEFCKKQAKLFNLELVVVCGIVAALSPACSWEQNKKDSVALMKGKKKGFVTYKRNVEKALSILKRDIDPASAFNPRTGAKTYNFFHNLLWPECDHHVTIDRHAFRVATGKEYPKVHPALYEKVANHYRKAAKRLNIRPMDLQAVLWVSYRRENNIRQNENIPF